MFSNYFKIAIRTLMRNRMLTFVNMAGLSIALACVMLILLFVHDEYSYDKFQKKGDRIYRLVFTSIDSSGKEFRSGNSGHPHGTAIASELPEVESFCRLRGWPVLMKNGTEGMEATAIYVDPTFLDMFSFKVIKGNPSTMLNGLNSVVITEEAAEKYFGKDEPIGKTIELEGDEDFEPYIVTGVVKTPPVNSSIRFDIAIPFAKTLPTNKETLDEMSRDWSSTYLNTFFLMKEGTNVEQAEKKLWSVFEKYNGEDWKKYQQLRGPTEMTFELQPFYSMHLDNRFFASNGLQNWSNAKYSYILTGIAALLLLIACINFINIALARSMKRSKEIGIRKVSGSSKAQLVTQFMMEAFVVTALAFAPAFVLAKIFLPAFNEVTSKHFEFSYLLEPRVIYLFLGLLFAVTILAGSYPAFVVTRFRPVQTLYSQVKLGGRNLLGKSLVVLQFVIAAGLIICVLVFNKQFQYMTKSDLGYNYNNVIRLEIPFTKPETRALFKNEMMKVPSFTVVGAKSGDWNKTNFKVKGKPTDLTYYEIMDDKYLQALQIPLVKGRYLDYSIVADTVSNCLVNEAFVEKFLDKNQDPIGQQVEGRSLKGPVFYSVVGVVKNYHSADFKESIQPIYYALDKRGSLFNMYFRYEPGKTSEVLAGIQSGFKKIFPYSTMTYSFMDEWIEHRYAEDSAWKKIVSFSALIAILVSCLGLFALAALSVEQRVKEIGIRKVLGASAANITALVSKDFLKLVIIALFIASPIAWWVMNNWLSDFFYRINIGWWIFGIASGLSLLIALVSVSYQAIKAATANPVKSLRTE